MNTTAIHELFSIGSMKKNISLSKHCCMSVW